MKSLKLVSDFEGIWTNKEQEAAYVWNNIVKKLSTITRFSEIEINRILDESKSDMDKQPYKFGWMNNGKIAVYYREDLFGDNNAVFNFISRVGSVNSFSVFKQELAEIKKCILEEKYESAEKFSDMCYMESTKKFKESGKLVPHLNAKTALDKVLEKGVDVVIASNSGTERIEHLCLKLGKKLSNDKSFKRSNVYSLGNAKRYIISQDYTELPESLHIKKYYDVPLRRKFYHHLLLGEMPDYVIGDVFSMDLALPLYLRMNDPKFKKLKIIQKVQKYTPDWVTEYLAKEEFKGKVFMIEDIKELPKIISWN